MVDLSIAMWLFTRPGNHCQMMLVLQTKAIQNSVDSPVLQALVLVAPVDSHSACPLQGRVGSDTAALKEIMNSSQKAQLNVIDNRDSVIHQNVGWFIFCIIG